MAKKTPTAVTIKETEQEASVAGFISQAIAQNLPVETMERLFTLREKVKAEVAKEAFVKALGHFQKQCPVIKKTKKVMNKDGRTVRYMYAPLDSIVEQIKVPLSDNGLSYSWDVKHVEGHMNVICKITHTLGHSDTSNIEIPIGDSEFMTRPQAYASAQTFAKRYTLCNALGISTGDEDTDATDVGKEKTAKSDKAKIVFLLRQLGLKSDTKENIAAEVVKATKLELNDKNLSEIVTRLEVLVKEQHESQDIR